MYHRKPTSDNLVVFELPIDEDCMSIPFDHDCTIRSFDDDTKIDSKGIPGGMSLSPTIYHNRAQDSYELDVRCESETPSPCSPCKDELRQLASVLERPSSQTTKSTSFAFGSPIFDNFSSASASARRRVPASIADTLDAQYKLLQGILTNNHEQTLTLIREWKGFEEHLKSESDKLQIQFAQLSSQHAVEAPTRSIPSSASRPDVKSTLRRYEHSHEPPMPPEELDDYYSSAWSKPHHHSEKDPKQLLLPRGTPSVSLQRRLFEAAGQRDVILSEMLTKSQQNHSNVPACRALHPYSLTRVLWDLIGGVLIMHDLIRIPLRVFDFPDNPFDVTMLWLSIMYWSADIPRQFLIGFEAYGELEMRFKPIAQRYAKSWLFPDVLFLSADWTSLCVMGNNWSTRASHSGRAPRAIQVIRVMRLIRLARAVKIPRMSTALLDTLQSERILVLAKFTYLMLAVMLIVHYIGCYWHALVDLNPWGGDGETNWREAYHLESTNAGDLYMISLHWAISQSGLSASNIRPKNSVERLYACLSTLLWLTMLAGVFTSFNAWMMQIREASLECLQQEALIRRYLHTNDVTRDFTSKILRIFHMNYKLSQRRVHERDIPFFNELPTNMRVQLHAQVFAQTLKKLPILAYFAEQQPLELLTICHCCMLEHHHPASSILFKPGEQACEAFFVVSGTLSYRFKQLETQKITEGDWICEPVLWTEWVHTGHLEASTSTELVGLSGDRWTIVFHELSQNGVDMGSLTKYALIFLESMEEAAESRSDIWPDAAIRERITQQVVGHRKALWMPNFRHQIQVQPFRASCHP